MSWYVNGGFTDENGVRHDSGYHYKMPVWEVLNEADFEHNTTPEQYTARYDAIVERHPPRQPGDKIRGHGAGRAERQSALLRVLPRIPPTTGRAFRSTIISYHFYAVADAERRTSRTGSTPSSTRPTDS